MIDPFRPRFSLRTMFVVVTVVCIYLAYSLNWIRQRHEFLLKEETTAFIDADSPATAPFSLRLFGEQGYSFLSLNVKTEQELERLKNLFPEAVVWPAFPVSEARRSQK